MLLVLVWHLVGPIARVLVPVSVASAGDIEIFICVFEHGASVFGRTILFALIRWNVRMTTSRPGVPESVNPINREAHVLLPKGA